MPLLFNPFPSSSKPPAGATKIDPRKGILAQKMFGLPAEPQAQSSNYYPDDPALDELVNGPSFALPQAGGPEPAVPTSYPSPIQTSAGPHGSGLSQYYEGGPEHIDLSQIWNPEMNPEIQQMIGGMGFSPEILAAMRAGAIEDTSNAGLSQMGQMRRGLSASGIGPQNIGGANYMANIARQTGDKQSAALRDISIGNAVVGNENRKFGLNLAHSYAVEKANRLFEGMGQNLSQSGANTRTAVSTAFGENPFNPGSGIPQQSRFGPAATGAANAIQFPGTQQQNPARTPPFVAPDQTEQAFSRNPFKGY